jgi:hypothetical protein
MKPHSWMQLIVSMEFNHVDEHTTWIKRKLTNESTNEIQNMDDDG